SPKLHILFLLTQPQTFPPQHPLILSWPPSSLNPLANRPHILPQPRKLLDRLANRPHHLLHLLPIPHHPLFHLLRITRPDVSIPPRRNLIHRRINRESVLLQIVQHHLQPPPPSILHQIPIPTTSIILTITTTSPSPSKQHLPRPLRPPHLPLHPPAEPHDLRPLQHLPQPGPQTRHRRPQTLQLPQHQPQGLALGGIEATRLPPVLARHVLRFTCSSYASSIFFFFLSGFPLVRFDISGAYLRIHTFSYGTFSAPSSFDKRLGIIYQDRPLDCVQSATLSKLNRCHM
ncbi:hypothetical protein F5Y15DRAFT_427621, partial [Xylariaceae sp. FL0016]